MTLSAVSYRLVHTKRSSPKVIISKMAICAERELFELFLFIDSEESESDYESDDEVPQNGETHDESTSDEVEVRVRMIFFFENLKKKN